MRIVDRKTFLSLPVGTIYCCGVQWVFDSISIKGESLPDDWFYLNPAWPSAEDSGAAIELLERSLVDGTSFQMEDAEGRDGSFDDDAVFMIFEPVDLVTLQDAIDRALTVANNAGGQGVIMSKATLYCSFCGKSEHECGYLAVGPSVLICNECVELCRKIGQTMLVKNAVVASLPANNTGGADNGTE